MLQPLALTHGYQHRRLNRFYDFVGPICAAAVPRLQIRIFIALLQFVAAHRRLNDHGHADQWRRDNGQRNLRPREILRSDYANLRADDRAGVHDECDQQR
jgi:hypothetical protein